MGWLSAWWPRKRPAPSLAAKAIPPKLLGGEPELWALLDRRPKRTVEPIDWSVERLPAVAYTPPASTPSVRCVQEIQWAFVRHTTIVVPLEALAALIPAEVAAGFDQAGGLTEPLREAAFDAIGQAWLQQGWPHRHDLARQKPYIIGLQCAARARGYALESALTD